MDGPLCPDFLSVARLASDAGFLLKLKVILHLARHSNENADIQGGASSPVDFNAFGCLLPTEKPRVQIVADGRSVEVEKKRPKQSGRQAGKVRVDVKFEGVRQPPPPVPSPERHSLSLTSGHWDLTFKARAHILHQHLAKAFVKRNGRGISLILSPLSKLRQPGHSGVLGEVEGEECVLVVGLGEPYVGKPILAEQSVTECVVLRLIPPRLGRSCKETWGSGLGHTHTHFLFKVENSEVSILGVQ